MYDYEDENLVLGIIEAIPQYTYSIFPGSSVKRQVDLSAYQVSTPQYLSLEC